MDPLGTPRGAQERPKGALGASWEHVSVFPARPGSARRVPKGAPGRPNGRPGAPGSAPRRPKSTPDRVREQQTRVSCVRLGREAYRSNFSSNFENLAPSKSDDVNARHALFEVSYKFVHVDRISRKFGQISSKCAQILSKFDRISSNFEQI